jgi:hypothetical protein
LPRLETVSSCLLRTIVTMRPMMTMMQMVAIILYLQFVCNGLYVVFGETKHEYESPYVC